MSVYYIYIYINYVIYMYIINQGLKQRELKSSYD